MYRDLSQVPMQRRNFERRDAFLPIQYKERGRNLIPYTGTSTRDLSPGGAKILVEDFISPNTSLIVMFPAPPFTRELHAIARVAWVVKLPHSDQYEAGLEFRGLGSSDQREIELSVEKNKPPLPSTQTFA